MGSALVYLGLVKERVQQATPSPLLEPAVEDLEKMEILITRAQRKVREIGVLML
jgi:hypothetical protein